MTDFLTSLMARSFGTETAIRPRVASLFEPVRNGDTALREQHAAEPMQTAITREVDVESQGERNVSRPTPPTLQEDIQGRAEPMQTAIAREVEVESQGERNVSRPTPPTLQEDIQGRDAKHFADANATAAVLPPREDSERRRTTVLADETTEKEDTVFAAKMRPRREWYSHKENSIESEPELRSDSDDDASKRASARTPAVSPARDEFVEKDHRGLVLTPKLATALTAQTKTAALAMNAGLSAPVRERARMALPVLAAEPEHSVHVTIGRIEVRATSEIKQTGRPRPASPVMSLEEYLHRCTQRGSQ